MIEQVFHQEAGRGPADVTIALAVARRLHAPAAPEPRVAEIIPAHVPQLMGLRRSSADRRHRRGHKVPLHRLTAMRGLAALGA
ncbi:hypothetical protein ACF09H_30355 [Streptomyces sp. NPDC014983]|uniref:hypothetical protein n=1 Tax=unclassified Streptomyces TaxID=2593676 RepID=UPI0033185C4A